MVMLSRKAMMGASGAGEFSPADIDGRLLWYDATVAASYFTDTAGTTQAVAGNTVQRHSDQFGVNHLLSNPRTAVLKEALAGTLALYYGGAAALNVDSIADELSGTDTPFTLSVVVKPTVFDQSYYLWAAGGATPYTSALLAIFRNNATNDYRVLRVDNSGTNITRSGGKSQAGATIITLLFSGTKVTLRVDGVPVIDEAEMDNGEITFANAVYAANKVNTSFGSFMTGYYGSSAAYSRRISDSDALRLEAYLAATVGKTLDPSGTIYLSTPERYHFIQRNGSSQGDIAITGYVKGGPYDIEARFNGGTWTTIASAVTSDLWSGTLAGQAAGQGSVEVRVVGGGNNIASVADVSIGDVFVVAGQSNASGRGSNSQVYRHPSLKALLFANDYNIKPLTDPYDRNTDQQDVISGDPDAAGSWIPLLAQLIAEHVGVPTCWIPACNGGRSVTHFQPGIDHLDRTTHYGSLNNRAQQFNAVKCVLWWQGETDAINQMDQATYNSNFDTFVNAVAADLGAKTMPCLLQNSTAIPDADEGPIRAAVTEAVGDNANVLVGPDFSDIDSDDDYHFKTDVKLQEAASRWWVALRTVFYS